MSGNASNHGKLFRPFLGPNQHDNANEQTQAPTEDNK